MAEKESKLEKKEKKNAPEDAEDVVTTAKDSDDDLDLDMDLDEDEPFDYDKARKILERARSMKSIHWHRRKEHGKTRSTLVFKMGDES